MGRVILADISPGLVGFPYTFVIGENRAKNWLKFIVKAYLPVFYLLIVSV